MADVDGPDAEPARATSRRPGPARSSSSVDAVRAVRDRIRERLAVVREHDDEDVRAVAATVQAVAPVAAVAVGDAGEATALDERVLVRRQRAMNLDGGRAAVERGRQQDDQ